MINKPPPLNRDYDIIFGEGGLLIMGLHYLLDPLKMGPLHCFKAGSAVANLAEVDWTPAP